MIIKSQREMIKQFVKKANTRLDLYKDSQVKLVFLEMSNHCYVCDIIHYGKVVAEDVKHIEFVVMYMYGVGMGIDNIDLKDIWESIVRFDHYVNRRL